MSQKETKKSTLKLLQGSFFERSEHWLGTRSTKLFWGLFAVFALLCFLQFDVRLSGANDDATYVEAGYNFTNGEYYTSQAPLYPMFLAFPIAIWGINLIVMKLSSLIFSLVFFYFFYRGFKGRIPNLLLFTMLVITAVNYYFLYYASHTFVEAFFLALQAVFFGLFFKLTEKIEATDFNWKKNWMAWLLPSMCALLLLLAKNVALGIIPILIAYFLFRKQYKFIIISLAAFGITFGAWTGVKLAVWGNQDNYGTQSDVIFQKDPYNAGKGKEDAKGFAARFFDNSKIYISNRLMEVLNLKNEDDKGVSPSMKKMGYKMLNEKDETKMGIIVSSSVTIFVSLLFLLGVYWVYKNKQKFLQFTAIYVTVLIAMSFVIIHPFWAQHRYIYIFMPYVLLIIFYGLYCTVQKVGALQYLLPLLAVWLVFANLSLNDSKIKKQGRTLAAAYYSEGGAMMTPYKAHFKLSGALLSGDKYSGYTPDWGNYLRMCEWVSKNIPDSQVVACRKPAEAFIYANGRHFYPCHKALYADSTNICNPDSNLNMFKNGHVKYIILSNFRLNPEQNNGQIINTIQRILGPIEQKYPGKLKQVRTEGTAEQAVLYEIIEGPVIAPPPPMGTGGQIE
ncbi:MAG: hypothetical protein EXR21_09040 [Flavobacteriaceae bacterium]|nr:hypothetical protein [Flavobacteriaceae bacterium]